MRIRAGVVVVLGSCVFGLATASASRADEKMRNDRVNMAKDMGVIILGAARGNPGVALLGTANLGIDTIRYRIHKREAGDTQSGGAPAPTYTSAPAQAESLVAVPQRPGYYYYPSNPGQLYYDAQAEAQAQSQAQAQATESMKSRIESEKIVVENRISIWISNPTKEERAIECLVGESRFSIPSGMVLVITAVPGSVISYDRGDRSEPERFTLSEGNYEFRSIENGRRLYKLTPAQSVARGIREATKLPSTSSPELGATAAR